MRTGMKAMTCLSVSRSRKAASWTTQTSHSQSLKAAGLSRVHFFQSYFHIGPSASFPHLHTMAQQGVARNDIIG